MTAKHILAARTNGPEAGLEVFMNAPISRRWPAYAEISKKRTDKTRLAAYCKIFGEQFEGRAVAPAVADQDINDVQGVAEQLAALQAQLAALTGGAVVLEDSDDDAVVTSTEFITHDAAWQALGSDPTYRARKVETRGEPATNGQLYRLNTAGSLSLNV